MTMDSHVTDTSENPESLYLWEKDASFRTTGQFGRLDGGYVKHCAPTAMVNVLLSFEHRAPSRPGRRIIPAQAFRRIVSYGLRRHYYFNSDRFRFFGGTLNLISKVYLRAAFALYGRQDFRTGLFTPAFSFFLRRALKHGAILYLILVRHPSYGNHHAVAYGYRMKTDEKGKRRMMLVTADGWSETPQEMAVKDLKLSYFFPVYPGRKRRFKIYKKKSKI
ncbi:MAG: hypothetical protein IJP92_17690 [Lachnospiraceae bacterium]|nr:hypothetical protein [Lachnospiraceae bacterium]